MQEALSNHGLKTFSNHPTTHSLSTTLTFTLQGHSTQSSSSI